MPAMVVACIRTQLYSAARRGDAETANKLLQAQAQNATESEARSSNSSSSFTATSSPNIASLALFEGNARD